MTDLITRIAVIAAVAAAIWAGAAAPAMADTDPGDTDDSDMTVSVPQVVAPTILPTTTGPTARSNTSNPAAPADAPSSATTPVACVPKEPVVSTTPATGDSEAATDKDFYVHGETLTATAAGFGAAEQVTLTLYSEPTLAGTFTADATGTVTASFPIAAETLAGSHTLQFTGWCGAISTAKVLVGASDSAFEMGVQGVPAWAWWTGGGVGGAMLVAGAWWAVKAMRAPAAALAAVVM